MADWFKMLSGMPPRKGRCHMKAKPLIVGIGGTLRPASSTERALQIALAEAARSGARTITLRGVDLNFPLYNPDDRDRTVEAQRFVDLVHQCDGLIVGTPAYHGSISGLVKNALDYIEDLRDDRRPYLEGRAVGCVITGAGWQAIGSTLGAMRSIIHALRGWPTPLGAGLNTTGHVFDSNGLCVDRAADEQLKVVGRQVSLFTRAFEPNTSAVSIIGETAA
jgi:FMN reductase